MGPYGNFLGGLHFKFLEKYLLGHPNNYAEESSLTEVSIVQQ